MCWVVMVTSGRPYCPTKSWPYLMAVFSWLPWPNHFPWPHGANKTGSDCCSVPNCIVGCMGTVDAQVTLWCSLAAISTQDVGSTPTGSGRPWLKGTRAH